MNTIPVVTSNIQSAALNLDAAFSTLNSVSWNASTVWHGTGGTANVALARLVHEVTRLQGDLDKFMAVVEAEQRAALRISEKAA